MARHGLGRGMDDLFATDSEITIPQKHSDDNKSVVKEVVKMVQVPEKQELNINEIEPNNMQPRKDFNEDALQELAESIKQYGIIEPLVVTNKGNHYEIIAGERRWRAARIAGIKKVPVVIREYTDQERMEIALIENIQREDLNSIEEALAYKSLIDEYNMTQDEVSQRVSKSRTAITNSIRLLKLTDDVKQMLIDGMISSGHARCLVSIEDPAVQKEAATEIFDEGLSVRETEDLVKNINSIVLDDDKKTNKNNQKNEAIRAVLDEMSENLKNVLGTKVTVKSNGKKGKIEIGFSSSEDLERIIHFICNR